MSDIHPPPSGENVLFRVSYEPSPGHLALVYVYGRLWITVRDHARNYFGEKFRDVEMVEGSDLVRNHVIAWTVDEHGQALLS